MNRIIKSMENKYLESSLNMIRRTFTQSEDAENAEIVVSLVREIRSKEFYLPELELVMVNEEDEFQDIRRFRYNRRRECRLACSPVPYG